MTLKEFCRKVGWDRVRRWSQIFEEIRQIVEALEISEKRQVSASVSPYFDQLFGDWRPNPEIVKEVMASMETRPIGEVSEAVSKSPIGRSKFRGGQGWVNVDAFVELTTLACAEKIIRDTPVETLKYIKEKRDCDDLAEIFESLARLFYGVNVRVVISVTEHHAFIGWPLLANGKVVWKFLEPQDDGWVEVYIKRNEASFGGRNYKETRLAVDECLIV